MAKHPLDISNFLGLDPKDITKPKKQFKDKPKPKKHVPQQSFEAKQTVEPQESNQQENEDAPRIEKQYWQQLNPESRRIFTSRMWKNVDFNPMLSELTDLSKLTEKWLRWAIPTYANGIKGGPIKDWFEGKQGDRDFHYVLVGEHLKHLKDVRQKRKEEDQPSDVEVHIETENQKAAIPDPEPTPITETEIQTTEGTPIVAEPTEIQEPEEIVAAKTEPEEEEKPASAELQMALNDLDVHIHWFQNYLDSTAVENDPEKS
jgi:hypothetical protein